ncbi:MAG: hypothetical protein PVH88_26970 [Ignavibacteria bacterium]
MILKPANRNRNLNVNREEGYTLVEILVGINLSFILISLLISTYLFASKLTSSSIKQIENKMLINTFLSMLYSGLQKSETYILQEKDNSFILIINRTDTTYFSNNGVFNNGLINIGKVASNELSLFNEEEEIVISNGVLYSDPVNGSIFNFTSSDIKRIRLTIELAGKKYVMFYENPKYLKNNFKNVAEDYVQ